MNLDGSPVGLEAHGWAALANYSGRGGISTGIVYAQLKISHDLAVVTLSIYLEAGFFRHAQIDLTGPVDDLHSAQRHSSVDFNRSAGIFDVNVAAYVLYIYVFGLCIKTQRSGDGIGPKVATVHVQITVKLRKLQGCACGTKAYLFGDVR